jgi:hypothetical protein
MNDEPTLPPIDPTGVPPEPAPAAAPPPSPAVAHETAEQAIERAEKRETRRRWVSLAEIVGVGGLIIAAAGLWMGWSDRRADVADKQATQAIEDRAHARVMIVGEVSHDGETITLSDTAHPLHDVAVDFPAELGVSQQSGFLGPKIESSWFEEPLMKLADKMHQGRLPVMLTATWWDGDTKRTDRAIYEIAWSSDGRLLSGLRGRKLHLRSLVLSERNASPARLEAAWARLKPRG